MPIRLARGGQGGGGGGARQQLWLMATQTHVQLLPLSTSAAPLPPLMLPACMPSLPLPSSPHPLCPLANILGRGIVEEKEIKLRELLYIHGLRPRVLFAAWWLTYLVVFLAVSLLSVLVAGATFLSHSSWTLLLAWLTVGATALESPPLTCFCIVYGANYKVQPHRFSCTVKYGGWWDFFRYDSTKKGKKVLGDPSYLMRSICMLFFFCVCSLYKKELEDPRCLSDPFGGGKRGLPETK